MNYIFSKTSEKRLSTCHIDLQNICHEVLKHVDISVICGHRTAEEHSIILQRGNSKVIYGKSKHSHFPSLAVDIAPWPMKYGETNDNDINRFYYLAGVFKTIAYQLGIVIRFGGDWNSNNDFSDQKFNDLFHFELVDGK